MMKGEAGMRRCNFIGTVLIAALVTACSSEAPEMVATPEEPVSTETPESQVVEYLFVQHVESVTLADNLLTLEGIGDDVLYFSDRPHRIMGRETIEEFLDDWDEGEESFASIPPNAVLTTKKGDEIVDVVMVLKEPVLTDRQLVYKVEVLDGPEAGTGGKAALFIDGFLPPPGGKPDFVKPPGGKPNFVKPPRGERKLRGRRGGRREHKGEGPRRVGRKGVDGRI